MTTEPLIALLLLLLVHFLFDFAFQPDSWVRAKRDGKNKYSTLLKHSLLHGLFSYLVLCAWSGWLLPLLIVLTHYLIDLVKTFTKDTLRSFIADQCAHACSIVLLWALFYDVSLMKIYDVAINLLLLKHLLFVLVVVLLFQPSSVLIRKLTEKMADQLKEKEGIKNAGCHIGYIERLLIFVFIVAGRLEVVGFILAAKSIFRFGDLQRNEERVKTEYYIIGTLLSFGLACIVGLIFNKLFN